MMLVTVVRSVATSCESVALELGVGEILLPLLFQTFPFPFPKLKPGIDQVPEPL